MTPITSTELCPHCGTEFDYTAETVTEKVKCPECGEMTMQCNMCEDMNCSECTADLNSSGKGVK